MSPGKIHRLRTRPTLLPFGLLFGLLFGGSVGLAQQRHRGVDLFDSSTGGETVQSRSSVPTELRPCSTLISILDENLVLQALERGETYLIEIDRPKKRKPPIHALSDSNRAQTGIAVAAIRADMEEVIEVLADDNSFAEVFPYVAEAKSREVGDRTVVYQFIDLPFPIRNLWYEVLVERRREVTESGSCFESQWRYVPESGNIVDTEGRWELLERKDGALLIAYVAWAEAGGMIPKWAENWAARRALPKIIEGLRGEIERRR